MPGKKTPQSDLRELDVFTEKTARLLVIVVVGFGGQLQFFAPLIEHFFGLASMAFPVPLVGLLCGRDLFR